MQHRIFIPLLLQTGDGKTLEQVATTVKIGVKRGKKKALAETARARQEIVASCRNKLIDPSGLIHIQIVTLAYLLEILDAYRKVLKCHDYLLLFCIAKIRYFIPISVSKKKFFPSLHHAPPACTSHSSICYRPSHR